MATNAAIKEPVEKVIGNKSYDEALVCNNGLLNIRRCSRWGYIDKNGKEITPIKYDGPSTNFVDGKAQVKYNRSYFTVDETTGEEHEI